MLGDDISGIRLGDRNRPEVLPAFPEARLWVDSAGKLGHDVESMGRLHPDWEKYSLSAADRFAADPSPLLALYALEPWEEDSIEIDDLTNSQKFDVVIRSTYWRDVVDGLGLRPSHFRLAVAAANAAVVRRVRRPISGFRLQELADAVEADFRGLRPRES